MKITDRLTLRRIQQKRLQIFRRRVMRRTKFYQDRWSVPLRELPIINKAQYLDDFGSFNTKGIDYHDALAASDLAAQRHGKSTQLSGITIGFSTGTTGRRGVFLATPTERIRWLGVILARTLPNGFFSHNRIALFLAANSKLYQTTSTLPNLQFQFFDLHEDIESHVERLNKFSPTVLVGTALSLRLLSVLKRDGSLRITPKHVISGGEVLEQHDATFIHETFGEPPGQIYQCTEGFFGATCPYGTIHLNEDFQIFEKEWVDRKNGRFVPIVTDLSRDTQALVRYRMNDILVEKTSICECGSVLAGVEKIEGRCDDAFLVPSSDGLHTITVLPEVLRTAVSSALTSIDDYRLKQSAPMQISLTLPDRANSEEVALIEKLITEKLSKMGCKIPNIQTLFGIDHSMHKKLRRIERSFAIGIEI